MEAHEAKCLFLDCSIPPIFSKFKPPKSRDLSSSAVLFCFQNHFQAYFSWNQLIDTELLLQFDSSSEQIISKFGTNFEYDFGRCSALSLSIGSQSVALTPTWNFMNAMEASASSG